MAVSVTVSDESTLAEGDKVLISSVTLSGNIATVGILDLTGHGTATVNGTAVTVPTWTVQEYSDKTVTISNAPAGSYGIVAEAVRYIEDLPYRWQPAGLQKGKTANVLSADGHKAYLYLIPQSSLTLTTTVNYCVVNSTTVTPGIKTVTDAVIATPLYGNMPYLLNLIITI